MFDTAIPWLNDYLAVYATGVRVSKRTLYTDTDVSLIERRGYLALTSRDPQFNREDVASRVIPFKFRPIEDHERKNESELLMPILKNRGRIWGRILTVAAQVQDALPYQRPSQLPGRLADFIGFGWQVAEVLGRADQWAAMAPRLRAAQAGFALDGEPLFDILRAILAKGDLPRQKTSELWERIVRVGDELGLPTPRDAASCTKTIKQFKELLEGKLDIQIELGSLDGYTMITITKGQSWNGIEVSEVREALTI